LLRANPSAFIDGNVNRLRAGAILTIPSATFVEELDAVTADAEFAAQNRRWQASVATSQRPVEAPPRAAASAPAPALAPTATESQGEAADDGVEVATDEQGQLRIVTENERLDMASASEQDLKEQLLLTMEEIESNRITTGAIESRLGRLEGELDRMQELVDLKDAQIAQLQSELAARETAAAAPPGPADQQRPDAPQGINASAIDAAGPTAATPPARAVTPLPNIDIDAPPLVAEQTQVSAWYEQYLWVVWALLGLLGLTAITMMLRRPQAAAAEVPMADLPTARTAPTPVYPREAALTEEDFKQAEADLRDIAEEPVAKAFPDELPEEELPELEIPKRGDKAGDIQGGITDSLLDEMLQEGKQFADSPATPARAADFTDEDIASWVAELGAEADRSEARSANDDQVETEEDIPSILTELDDQLTASQLEESPPASGIKLDPLDGVSESDAFNMSLDLARAYLEIGDQEGARDMLKQALSGARDPEHRRQIEELLQQIG